MQRKTKFENWRAWLPTLGDHIKLYDPASETPLQDIEIKLGIKLPEHLRSLLLASDGVRGRYGFWLVWPSEKIITENLSVRTTPDLKALYMPFDHLLFIGEGGNGDLFAYPIMADGNAQYHAHILRWNHESDDRCWIANNLAAYIEGISNGTIIV